MTITDLDDLVALMELNIRENRHLVRGRIEAKALRWGDDVTEFGPCPDVILMADCIYYEEASRVEHSLANRCDCVLLFVIISVKKVSLKLNSIRNIIEKKSFVK